MKTLTRYYRVAMLGSLVAALILLLSYQVKRTYTVFMGSPGDYHYLGGGFYYPESQGEITFRWAARRSEVILPGLGGHAPLRIDMVLQGWRPAPMASPTVTVSINQRVLTDFSASPELSLHSYEIPTRLVGWQGDLHIALQASNTFKPSETINTQDTRKLGLLISTLSVTQAGSLADFVVPPASTFVLLLLACASVQALFIQWGLRPAWSMVAVVLAALGLGYAVGWHRLVIARLAWVPLVCGVAINVVVGAYRWAAHGQWRVAYDERAILAALLLALGGLRYFESGVFHQRDIPPVDFGVDYAGASVVRRGGMVYDLEFLGRVADEVIVPNIPALHESIYTSYDNPPFTAVLMLPFTFFPWGQAQVLYRILLHLAYWGAIFLIMDTSEAYRRYPHWLFLLVLALMFEPAYASFTAGQVDIPIFLSIVVGYWAYKRRHPWLCGAAIAVGAMIKLSPALLLPYLLYKRQVKPVVAGIVTCVVLLGVSVAITGPDDWHYFVTRIMPELVAGNAHFENQTLNGFLRGLFVPATDLFSLNPPPYPNGLRLLSLAVAGSLAASMLWLFWQPKNGQDAFRFDVEFSLCLVALLIVSSVAWPHYYVWTLLPLATLLKPDVRTRLTQREYVLGAVAYGLAVGLINFPLGLFYQWPVDFYATHWPWRLLLWLKFYGALILTGLLIVIAKRLRSGQPVASPSQGEG